MSYDVNATTNYIREAARRRGIDPEIAVRVAKSEGLGAGIWQSGFSKGGQREPSYGPFQMLVGGEGTNYPAGLGNDFKRRTGLDPSDPSNVNATIDFALDHASQNGWGAWYGAAKAGVGRRDGIGGGSPLVSAIAERDAPQGAAAAVSNMGAAGQGAPSSGAPMAAPTVNIGLKPKKDTKLLDAMVANAMRTGSSSQNPWDVVGSLAQVWAGTSEKRKAEEGEASELQKAYAAANLDPAYAMAAQLGGTRDSLAEALLGQQQTKTAEVNRAEEQAWRQQQADYQHGQDANANARADRSLTIQETAANRRLAADGPKTSLTPIYGTDTQGNAVLMQPRDDGTMVQSKMPDGVSVSTGVENVDAGTHYIVRDKRSGEVIGTIPKDNRGAARETAAGTVEGKTEAERTASSAGDAQSAQNALDLIKNIRDDPYRERGTGGTSLFNSIPGTGGFDFQQKVEQAKSGAFLTAIQQMKGLGALSNTEGSAATAAITRMNTAASEEGFMDALKDYEKIVQQALSRAQGNAASPAPAAPAASPVAPSPALDDLLKKYGG